MKKQREQTKSTQNNPGNENSGANNSNPNNNGNKGNNNNNNDKNSNRAERRKESVYPPCETCGKTDHSTEKCYFGAIAANRPPRRRRRLQGQNPVSERANQSDSNEVGQTVAQN